MANLKWFNLDYNWKSPDNYPPVKGTSLNKWAYLFMTRNQNFIAEYNAAFSRPVPTSDFEPIEWTRTPTGKVLKKYGVDSPMLPEWIEAGVTDCIFSFDVHPRLLRTYAVGENWGTAFADLIGTRYVVEPANEGRLVLEFDLTQPLNPQLERAKSMLKANQNHYQGDKRKIGKAIVNLFPWYLRVLDAYTDGVHPAKICEVLSLEYSPGVGDDTLRNWKAEAERLRDGGYLDLVKNPTP